MEYLDALNTAYALTADYVETNPSLWGRTMLIVSERQDNSKLWMYKRANEMYPRASIKGSCACEQVRFEDVLRLQFRKTTEGCYTYENEGVWVCMPYHSGVSNLKDASMPTESKRVALAKTLGALHACPAKGLRAPSFDAPPTVWASLDHHGVWDWIGSTASRVVRPSGHRDMTVEVKGVLAFIRDDRGAEIDALPAYPSTGDLQSKNVLCNIGGALDHCALINCEILIPLSRMWDVVWLLILDDAATGTADNGFADRGEPQTWASDFAHALAVYQEYCGCSFSDGEIFLFHNMLQVKVAQVACVVPEYREALLNVFWRAHEEKEVLRSILRHSAHSRCAEPVPCRLDRSLESCPYEHALKGLNESDLNGRSPILLHFNGTFMPIHLGHLETALAAAQEAERAFNGKVVGIMFSLCHPDHAKHKGGEGAEKFVERRALLAHLALHSNEDVAVELRQYHPFVDTYEMHHHGPGDLGRVEVCCQRFKQMTGDSGLVCMVAGLDTKDSRIPWVGSYLDVDPCVRAAVSLRQHMSPPTADVFGVDTEEGEARVVSFENVTQCSSTEVRVSPSTARIYSVGCCLRRLTRKMPNNAL